MKLRDCVRFSVQLWRLTSSSTRPGKLGWSGASRYISPLVLTTIENCRCFYFELFSDSDFLVSLSIMLRNGLNFSLEKKDHINPRTTKLFTVTNEPKDGGEGGDLDVSHRFPKWLHI